MAKALSQNAIPGLTSSKFYYFFRKIKHPCLDYDALIEKLDAKNY